jgi:hypothetical protein
VLGPIVEEDGGAFASAGLGQAVMQVVRRDQADAAVPVVAPNEEFLAVRAGVLDRAEALRKIRPLLARGVGGAPVSAQRLTRSKS